METLAEVWGKTFREGRELGERGRGVAETKRGQEGGEKRERVWTESAAGSPWSENMTQVQQERYGHKELSHRKEDNQKRNEARATDKSKESRAVNRDPGRTKRGSQQDPPQPDD